MYKRTWKTSSFPMNLNKIDDKKLKNIPLKFWESAASCMSFSLKTSRKQSNEKIYFQGERRYVKHFSKCPKITLNHSKQYFCTLETGRPPFLF